MGCSALRTHVAEGGDTAGFSHQAHLASPLWAPQTPSMGGLPTGRWRGVGSASVHPGGAQEAEALRLFYNVPSFLPWGLQGVHCGSSRQAWWSKEEARAAPFPAHRPVAVTALRRWDIQLRRDLGAAFARARAGCQEPAGGVPACLDGAGLGVGLHHRLGGCPSGTGR